MVRGFAEESLVVPISAGAVDLDSIYVANEVALRVWSCIDGKTPVSQILEDVCREFDVAADQAEKDVNELLHMLEEDGLISAPSGVTATSEETP